MDLMASFSALITVHADVDPAEADGIADVLGASEHRLHAGRLQLRVPGEAPDLATATAAARRHVAETLEDYPVDVEVQATEAD